MNDKWNPRLWLRDWLVKPSQAERSERRTGKAAATQVTCEESIEHDDRTVGTGFVLLADRPKSWGGEVSRRHSTWSFPHLAELKESALAASRSADELQEWIS